MPRALLIVLTCLLATSAGAEVNGFTESPFTDLHLNSSYAAFGVLIEEPSQYQRGMVILAPEAGRVEVWREYLDISSRFAFESNMWGSQDWGSAVKLADVDGDGPLDIVAADLNGRVVWSRNELVPDEYDWIFSNTTVIADNLPQIRAIATGDILGDDAVEVAVITLGPGRLIVFEELSPTTWVAHEIDSGVAQAADLELGDVNGDGLADLVAASRGGRAVHVWINQGDGEFFRHNLPRPTAARAVELADDNGDGVLDVISGWEDGRLIAHFWTGESVEHQLLTAQAGPLTWLDAGDIDQDGDPDYLVTVTAENQVTLFESRDGQIVQQQVAGDFLHPIQAEFGNTTDLPHPEVLVVDDQAAELRVFTPDLDSDWDYSVLFDGTGPGTVYHNHAADMDGDGDRDIITKNAESTLDILWNDGSGAFTHQSVPNLQGRFIAVADLDLNGYADVVTAPNSSGILRWYEHDGNGQFVEHDIDSGLENVLHVYATELTGDSYPDIIVDERWPSPLVRLYENQGDGEFIHHLLTDEHGYMPWSRLGDADGDGDLDLFGPRTGSDGLVWFENPGTPGHPWTTHGIHNETISVFDTGDLDGDGDLDVVASWWIDDVELRMVWFENVDGAGNFQLQDPPLQVSEVKDLACADLDLDGDIDIVGEDGEIFWLESLGDASFQRHAVGSQFNSVQKLLPVELTGDGAPEILFRGHLGTATDLLAMYSNAGFGGAGPIVSIQLLPFAPSLTVPPVGGTVLFDLHLANQSDAVQVVDLLGEVTPPGGGLVPVGGSTITLQPMEQREMNWLSLTVPTAAPAGAYTLTGITEQNGTALDSDAFDFTKLPAVEPSGTAPASVTAGGWRLRR